MYSPNGRKDVHTNISSRKTNTEIQSDKTTITKDTLNLKDSVNRPANIVSNILNHSSQRPSEQSNVRAAQEDDGVGWVNISNYKSSSGFGFMDSSSSSKKLKKKRKKRPIKVACLTTDFSMQNVLMQIGLNIVSVDGMVVKSIKQWILRCIGCYQVHTLKILHTKCLNFHLNILNRFISTWIEFSVANAEVVT